MARSFFNRGSHFTIISVYLAFSEDVPRPVTGGPPAVNPPLSPLGTVSMAGGVQMSGIESASFTMARRILLYSPSSVS
jgi:hypothetical protein